MYLFQNALALDPQNISTLVLVIAAAAWAALVLILMVDVVGDQRLSLIWKILWVPVICVPLVGGLFYSVFSLIRSLVSGRKED